jgi:NitT/TauT family transport system ATP-binding protein
MESLIRLDDLALGFTRDGKTTLVLEHLDLTVRRGEFLGLVGPSGVGKSTLLRVIAGLKPPTAGNVTIAPRLVPPEGATGDAAVASSVALVFQDARLLPWRRVIDNAAFGLERFSLSASVRRAKALAMLELVGLKEYANRYPHELSGGQRQRVSIARALSVEPDVLLMDEPFSALDPINRQTLQDELIRIWQETGKTILFVTHDIEEAAYLADRVVVLAGSPARVANERAITLSRPRSREDVALIATTRQIRQSLTLEAYIDGAGV